MVLLFSFLLCDSSSQEWNTKLFSVQFQCLLMSYETVIHHIQRHILNKKQSIGHRMKNMFIFDSGNVHDSVEL